ncbi:AAA family ATPase [Williamsia herbipolensis]|uniref:AAA family ATPase n=1 Tax=Williamsia herbipolensis TaxID=1603258 RepID=UPI0006981E64|nr:AAA family ATPase [Williamsia herbipolensis]
MTAYERVLDKFRAEGLIVDERGDKATAQAPGHSAADRSVTITRDIGKVLVFSHSDDTSEVLAAVGLSTGDLFDEPRPGSRPSEAQAPRNLTTAQQTLRDHRRQQRTDLESAHREEFERECARAEEIAAKMNPDAPRPNWSDPLVQHPEDRPPDLLGDMIDGEALDAMSFPPLTWVVPGIIPEGMGFLVAPPKAGKSWLTAGVGLACAAGVKALGHIDVSQRDVLNLALEDGPRRLQGRYRHLLSDGSIPKRMHSKTSMTVGNELATIRQFMDRHPGSLVIVDTLGRIKPSRRSGEEAYVADYRIGAQLKEIADAHPGSTLLVVHHTRKMESDDFVDSLSGTQGLAGAADFVLLLQRKRQSDEAILHVTGRDVPESEIALLMDNGSWRLSSPTLAQSQSDAGERRERNNKSDRTIRALEFVKGRDKTTSMELAAYLEISNNDAGTYLRRMYTDGLIDKQSRGVYVPVSEVSELSERKKHSDTVSDTDQTGRVIQMPLTSTKDTTDSSDTSTETTR